MRDFPLYRHWHAASEVYTGGDSLITALADGWSVQQATIKVHRLRGNRTSIVYRIGLARDHEVVVMPIISNPFITRFLSQYNITENETNWTLVGGDNHVEKTASEDKANL